MNRSFFSHCAVGVLTAGILLTSAATASAQRHYGGGFRGYGGGFYRSGYGYPGGFYRGGFGYHGGFYRGFRGRY